MKTYKRILGISSLIIVLSCTVALINLKFQNEIEWLTFFALLLPVYIIIHYLISSKFGFNETDKKQPFFIISSIVSIVALIIIPLSIYIADAREQRTIKENERIKQNELSETLEKLKLPIDLGKDTTVYNIECQLKTRYSNENLEYIFSAKYLKNERPKIEAFLIELKDSSGFVISEILIDSWTNILDSDSKTQKGYTENNKIGFEDFKEYQRINTFDVAIRTKN